MTSTGTSAEVLIAGAAVGGLAVSAPTIPHPTEGRDLPLLTDVRDPKLGDTPKPTA